MTLRQMTLTLMCLLVLGVAAPLARAAVPQTGSPNVPATFDARGYQLGTGDKVHVTVYGEPDLSGDFAVDGNGMVQLPLVGQIKAGGLTSQALSGSITAALADGYLNDPQVSIEIATYRPFYIIGEVNKPGEYAYVNGMTALNAIALAGGFTTRAEESALYLRKEGDTQEVRVAADASTRIEPGDILRVKQSTLSSIGSFLSPILPIVTPVCSVVTGSYC